MDYQNDMRIADYHEEEIIEGCLQGGRKYQKLLYERYYGSMIVVCMRYTNDREEARDVLHEGFIKVFRNLKKFNRGTNLGAWIRRIMINTAIDHYRKSAKRPNLVEINQAIHEADIHDVISDLGAEEILEMVQSRIDTDVEKLSTQKALVLACLRLAEDLYVFKNNTRHKAMP